MRKIAYENYTGKFMNNYFEGYGIFTVKYEIMKKVLGDSPRVANGDLDEIEDFQKSPRKEGILINDVRVPEVPL